MLTLITGNPGNGKTLYAVTSIEEQRLKEHRPVYYEGIPDLKYDWKPIEIAPALALVRNGENPNENRIDWASIPDGSIVVLDECYGAFPVRKPGSPVPKYVDWLARHRHRGFDIYLIAQKPTQLDTFVRDLVGKHIHFQRNFNAPYSLKYTWERLGDIKSKSDLGAAQTARFKFPSDKFGDYKSAVEHTHKLALPWKKILTLVIALGVAIGGFAYAFHRLTPKKPEAPTASASAPESAFKIKKPPGEAFWLESRRERVSGVPASAPVFDELQKVRSQPRVEGCMQLAIGNTVRCECTGPNHSRLDVGLARCMSYVQKGWFDETQKYEDPKTKNIAELNAANRQGRAEEPQKAM